MSQTGRTPRGNGLTSSRWQFLTLDVARNTGFGRHHHDEHQLVVVERGVIGLATPDAVWAVPQPVGVWLPAGAEHEVIGIADATVTFVYLTVHGWDAPPVGAVTLSPLLREVVAVLATPRGRRGDRRERLEDVLLDELADIQPVRLLVAMPSSPAARLAALAILDDPRDRRTIDQLGREVGLSGRTLQRRFIEETGMGFRDWRRRARLQRGTVELESGSSVTAAAYACGFSSVSAFVTAFGNELGTTPSRWSR